MTRKLRIKHSHLLIAAAGPAMNILFGLVLSGVFAILVKVGQPKLAIGVLDVVLMNIGLAIFNLIPCPPLDGGAILAGILPDDNPVTPFLASYGQFIFFGLLMTGALAVVMIPAGYVSEFWIGKLVSWVATPGS